MDVSADTPFRRSPGWLFVLALLVAVQGWLTLRLFGEGGTPVALINDAPIIDGKHPLHYYHGLLGHRSWHERGNTTCYDPNFQAGYLKTPIFDAGSRPAELFLLLGGPSPTSYKVGLAFCCLLVPLAFALAGRGAGLGAGGACLCALVGGTLFWSPPCRALLEAGDLDLLLGGICVPVYLTWLARYGRSPGPLEWTVLAGISAFAWYTHPILMLAVVPIVFFYHVLHSGRFVWHIGLFSANVAGIVANLFWLIDWVMHVRMYVPYGGVESPTRIWPTTMYEWEAFVPSDPVDLGACAIALCGLLVMLRRHASAAWLLGCSTLIFAVASGVGRLWPMAAEFGTHKVLSVGVWCCAVPCAYALSAISGGIASSSGFRPLGLVWLLIGLAGLNWGLDIPRRWDFAPLEVGLSPAREEIVKTIRERSTPEGRILWEERTEIARGAGWTALLPEYTKRPFIGGLTPDACVDHLLVRLFDGKLIGRFLSEWSDEELRIFFARYNVTRIVARTQPTITRLQGLSFVQPIVTLHNDAGVMFAVDRMPSYFLKGQGKITQLDWKRVALADVIPDENGVIVLSLHYHQSWHISPGYIDIERDVDANDPIPMLRLRLPSQVARVTLTWRGD